MSDKDFNTAEPEFDNDQWNDEFDQDWSDWDNGCTEWGGCGDGEEEEEIPIPLTQRVLEGGTTAKWKPEEFEGIKKNLAPVVGNSLLNGFVDGTDCTIIEVDNDQVAAFSLDWFPPLTDDYYAFGAISAAGALSKMYAVGVHPVVALNIMALPCKLGVESVGDVMKGGSDKVIEAGAFVVGGHSIDDAEPKYGLATFGIAKPHEIIRNEDAAPGDVLFCTKPLGTGILDKARHAEKEDDESMVAAIESMMELNKPAAKAMQDAHAHAAAAISESGLLGHLHSILASGGNAAQIDWECVPLFDRVVEHAEDGLIPLRAKQTARWIDTLVATPGMDVNQRDLCLKVLCDPQTSGGLIVAVPEEQADTFAASFKELAGRDAARIGRIVEGEEGQITIR